MCVTPSFVWVEKGPKWVKQDISCRQCWQCRKLRVDDLVGRCLAEKAYSTWSAVIALTYRDSEERESDLAHKVLRPRHVQDFIRSLRKRGHLIRYLATGEYGKIRGRAHWHVIIFGQGDKPQWPQAERFDLQAWPHGFSHVTFSPDERAMRYAVKYILKDDTWFSLSKKPPLGHAFFMAKAARDHALGVIPSRWRYAPPGSDPDRQYLLTGASRLYYFLELCRLSGKNPVELASKGNEWVQASARKVDIWLRRRDAQDVPIDQFMKAFAEELDMRDPRRSPPDGDYWWQDND